VVVMMVVVMPVMVMMMVVVLVVLHHRGSGGGRGRRDFLGEGVAGEADGERGGGDKALDHLSEPPLDKGPAAFAENLNDLA
jgi:preprotein translocase subunit SecG